MIKVSVIVPVYNIEAYVARCLDSLVQQDLKDIEIIVVNDGSTDNSPEICKRYAKKYPNIKYISQHNQGLSAARNTGIDAAKGEYIGFVDGDDFIKKEMFSMMYDNAIENNVLISCCGYEEYYDSGITYMPIASGIKKKYERDEALDLFLTERYFGVLAWNKIYKRELFKDIKFPMGKLFEDILTVYKLIDLADGLYYDSTVQYYYYNRSNSISNAHFNSKTLGIIEAVDEVVRFYRKNIGEPKNLYVGQAMFYLLVLGKMYRAGENDKKIVNSTQKIISQKLWRIFLSRHVSMRGKAKLFTVWLSPVIYKRVYINLSKLRDDRRSKVKDK